MVIVAVDRFVLIAPVDERDALLRAVQDFAVCHVDPFAGDADPTDEEIGRPPREVGEALKVLMKTRPRRRQVRDLDGFDLDAVVTRVLAEERRRLHLEDSRDQLEQRIAALSPWGDFRLPEPGELGDLRLWFYQVPRYSMRRMGELAWPWQVVHEDSRFAWVVVIAADEPPPGALPVPRTHTGARALSDLKRELDAVEHELEDLVAALQAETRWIDAIVRQVAEAADRKSLEIAARCTREDGELVLLQGFVPRERCAELQQLAERHDAAVWRTEPSDADRPPTLLDNPDVWGGGESMVGFYQTPGYRDWDPSAVVAFSFALFFAMILADAGYALLLALGLLWMWPRLGRSRGGRRTRAMAGWMLLAGVVYGALVGSWFGVTPPRGSALDAVHLLHLGDFDGMMRVTVVIGCFHLAFANAIVAWRARPWPRAMPSVGWILALFGGLEIWLGSGTVWQTVGYVVVGIGLVVVFVYASPIPVTRPLDLLRRGLSGAQALTAATRLFGDVLSYLRLFALGLASSSLAVTFNGMAHDVKQAVPGVGLLLAALLLLLGHTINLALALVGGFVHGLRLNFIEFYQWGLGEEGRPFRAFARRARSQDDQAT